MAKGHKQVQFDPLMDQSRRNVTLPMLGPNIDDISYVT